MPEPAGDELDDGDPGALLMARSEPLSASGRGVAEE